MNISLDTVKNWEQGYNYPSIDMLVLISELIENYSLLENIYSCTTANYGSVSTFIDVSDPFQPKGKRSMFLLRLILSKNMMCYKL